MCYIMKFYDLKYFLRYQIKFGGGTYFHQPITIMTILENNGHTTKQMISNKIKIWYNRTVELKSDHYVYKVLEKHKIIHVNENDIKFIDYDEYDEDQKKIITDICNQIIDGSQREIKTVEDHCFEFNYWLNTTINIDYEQHIKTNREKLSKIINQFESKNMNINLIVNYTNQLIIEDMGLNYFVDGYKERVLELIIKYEKTKDILKIIQEYEKKDFSIEPKYITPIFFYIEDNNPIINDTLNAVYDELAKIFGLNCILTSKLSKYENDRKCWIKLLEKMKIYGIKNMQKLQVFCYWYKAFIKTAAQNPDEWKILNFPEYTKNFETKKLRKKEGLVIFLDILGTKNLIYNDEGVNQFNLLIDTAKSKFTSNHNPDIINSAKFSYFSDTIMITIENKNYKNFSGYLNTVSEGLINFLLYAMQLSIFLRGCVSYGEYRTNKFVSVGKAIAEAGSYYELANWIGITATPSLYNKIIKDTDKDISLLFTEYDIPTKKGIEIGYALNFKRLFTKESDELKNLIRELDTQRDMHNDYDISMKYRNTIKFIKHNL